ncbi:helix-turn-helix domain-containing protein [Geomonas sp. Red32]|uniref:helix-turn-helix domain-containing protein n=1 Tax=Geomonas sp. Red32 TaxID=2912856 RepID=UPI00202CADC3|nr:helix-turn-helix domain-containing protein [Geomonas sp. Red32]MCM0082154.1 helix-turn-helix domain-containing protein [Geomonas sp. Red32]
MMAARVARIGKAGEKMDMIGVTAASKLFGVARRTLYNHIDNQKLPAEKVPSGYLFKLDDLMRLYRVPVELHEELTLGLRDRIAELEYEVERRDALLKVLLKEKAETASRTAKR